MRTLLCLLIAASAAGDPPLTVEERAKLKRSFDDAVARSTKAIEADPKDVEARSRRGDALFFQGNFKEAVADFDAMVALDAALAPGHWRRGIACFYAGRYEEAARQFEKYHTHDDVDRENGIWRFLSQAKAHGLEKAREGLLKYQKDDREPFPAIYRMFQGLEAPDRVLAQIKSAAIDDEERAKRLFYADLYIGLNFALLGKSEEAARHLREATANKWAPKGGYGPAWMWHVGRLHHESLARPAEK